MRFFFQSTYRSKHINIFFFILITFYIYCDTWNRPTKFRKIKLYGLVCETFRIYISQLYGHRARAADIARSPCPSLILFHTRIWEFQPILAWQKNRCRQEWTPEILVWTRGTCRVMWHASAFQSMALFRSAFISSVSRVMLEDMRRREDEAGGGRSACSRDCANESNRICH